MYKLPYYHEEDEEIVKQFVRDNKGAYTFSLLLDVSGSKLDVSSASVVCFYILKIAGNPKRI